MLSAYRIVTGGKGHNYQVDRESSRPAMGRWEPGPPASRGHRQVPGGPRPTRAVLEEVRGLLEVFRSILSLLPPAWAESRPAAPGVGQSHVMCLGPLQKAVTAMSRERSLPAGPLVQEVRRHTEPTPGLQAEGGCPAPQEPHLA